MAIYFPVSQDIEGWLVRKPSWIIDSQMMFVRPFKPFFKAFKRPEDWNITALKLMISYPKLIRSSLRSRSKKQGGKIQKSTIWIELWFENGSMVCSVLIWMGRPKWWFSVGGGDRFISQVHRTRSSLWYRFTWQAKQSYSLKGVERILNCVISPCRPALDQDLQPSSGNGGHKSPESVMAGYTPQQKPLRIWRTTRRVSLPQEYIYIQTQTKCIFLENFFRLD